MNVLRDADEEAWEQVRSGLSREVEPDLLANSRFWARYDGAAAEAADRINDQYLQANGQKEGIKSYEQRNRKEKEKKNAVRRNVMY